MSFDKAQIKTFVKQVKSEVGAGWPMLGPRIQTALVAERALRIVQSQVSESIKIETVDQLVNDMMAEAGLVG